MPALPPVPPDTHPPDGDARALIDRIHAYATLPEGAPPAAHERTITGLQHVFHAAFGEWLRALARAQGAGVLSHRKLTPVTGYAATRNVQERVYEGRRLLAEDDLASREIG